MVKEVTDTLVRVLSKQPEFVLVVSQEIFEGNWGFARLLTDEWKKSN